MARSAGIEAFTDAPDAQYRHIYLQRDQTPDRRRSTTTSTGPAILRLATRSHACASRSAGCLFRACVPGILMNTPGGSGRAPPLLTQEHRPPTGPRLQPRPGAGRSRSPAPHDQVLGQPRGEMDVIDQRGEPVGRGLRHVPGPHGHVPRGRGLSRGGAGLAAASAGLSGQQAISSIRPGQRARRAPGPALSTSDPSVLRWPAIRASPARAAVRPGRRGRRPARPTRTGHRGNR